MSAASNCVVGHRRGIGAIVSPWLRLASLVVSLMSVAIAHADDGIRFRCDPLALAALEPALASYFSSLGITSDLLVRQVDPGNGTLLYTLATPPDDVDTLTLALRSSFAIADEMVDLPTRAGGVRPVATVSKKEIVLALLQHGRLTQFNDSACRIEALQEHVGIRQNIVAWLEDIEWQWPDGGPAKWHARYWQRGTPQPGVAVYDALQDAFLQQELYAIGCYTAAKLAMAYGVLDYYQRVRPDAAKAQLVEQRLLQDQDPLVDIEPGSMWDFEADFDPREAGRPGKLLTIQYGVAARNFVPGDWAYFLNTDGASYQFTGYEGSNAIYLGRNRFVDYYNDNERFYTYAQKLDEVYQWRHGVFSRTRDAALIVPLSPEKLLQMSGPPWAGGLLLDLRVFPYFFSAGELPGM